MPGARERSGFLNEGLLSNMWRGMESTGLALVRHGKEQETPGVLKDAVPAYDFCRRHSVINVLNNMEDFALILGHTRSATRGQGNIARNAHPFQHGHITLTHNGTINNAFELVPHTEKPADVTVDSDMVALAMSKADNEQEVLEKLKGGYTLIWHNAKRGTLNIARNELKPLYFAFLEKENSMFWASEYSLLTHLMERRDMEIDGKAKWPEENVWLEFKLDKLREYTKTPFVHRPPIRVSETQSGKTGGGSGGNVRTGGTGSDTTADWTDPTPEQMQEMRDHIARGVSCLDMDDEASIAVYLRERKKAGNFKHSGHPCTPAKVQQAQRALKKLGLNFNQAVTVYPLQWNDYRKAKDKLGNMVGRTKDGVPVWVSQVKRSSWDDYKKFGKMYANAVNVKKLDNGKLAVVCMEHPNHAKLLARWLQESVLGQRISEPIPRFFRGPTGQLVSESKFLELTAVGCGNCTGWINPKDHEAMEWRGDSPPTPMCLDCTEAERQIWEQAKAEEERRSERYGVVH